VPTYICKKIKPLIISNMKQLITATLLLMCSVLFSQNANPLWKLSSRNINSKSINKTELPLKHLFELNVSALKTVLASSPKRDFYKTKSNTIISLPNGDGNMENFRVYENSVMDPILASKYPEIKSYVAEGIDNPSARAYFSNSPLGFKSMSFYPDQSSVFIEVITTDLTTYTAYKTSDKKASTETFECSTINQITSYTGRLASTSMTAKSAADDGKLRTFRLALACTAEYAALFGDTKADALAGMNNTITRINGVFERDFGVKLILVANNDALIYTDPLTDPYSDFSSKASWGSENQSNLDTTIGASNYDIGHLLGAGSGNCGDAGGRGNVCSNLYKGSGYTAAYSGVYQGDAFDIQFVAHEMGHQLVANHTFTYKTEGTVAQLEPGSGSTIMSYAGASMKDIQGYSDDYFHAISIQQVTDLIKTKSCAVVISTGNNVPVVNAGLDYTIPKGTPFILTGSATDANTDDVLTYTWEEMDLGTATTTIPSSTNTAGPLFRSYSPNSSTTRYFPNMATVLAGLTTTSGRFIAAEVLPGVTRTLKFRLTVRDNRAGGSANNTDDMIINVDGNSGPFTVDSQNSAASYLAGTTQTINWTVAGTNANGLNCNSVDVFLSTDGGNTFPITLLSATPNDGATQIVLPNITGTTNRIMVKGTNQIFFDVNNANFTITGSGAVDTAAPTTSTLSASGTTISGTNLSWTVATDNIGITGYNVYQNGVLKITTTTTSLAVDGLNTSTAYSFYVVAKDAAGNLSVPSNTLNVTTLSPADTTAPSASTLYASGTTISSTNLSWTAATDNVGISGYNVYQNGVFKTITTTESLAIAGLNTSTAYSFYVAAKDAAGNLSVPSNTMNVTTLSPADTTAPSASSLYASGTTISSTNLSWTAATDNIGITGYDVYQNGVLKTTTTTESLAIAGLNASTGYSFYVVATDAAGNLSASSNTANINTLNNTSLEYCSSYGISTAKEYIKNVQIGSINNTSDDNNGYGDYTSLSTNLIIGTRNTVVISPAWTSRSSSTEYYNIWIDFNQDGDFDDSDELVFSKSKTKAKTVNGSLVIPTNAISGSSRMRVSMKNDMLPNPCEIFSNGEVEDYTVSITSGATAKTVNTSKMSPLKGTTTTLDTAKPSLKLYPNPVKEDVIYISDIDSNPNYIIYNIMGTIVAKGVLKIKEINVGQLTRGIYIITLNDGLVTATKRFIKQ
jgi:chitodextrinase